MELNEALAAYSQMIAEINSGSNHDRFQEYSFSCDRVISLWKNFFGDNLAANLYKHPFFPNFLECWPDLYWKLFDQEGLLTEEFCARRSAHYEASSHKGFTHFYFRNISLMLLHHDSKVTNLLINSYLANLDPTTVGEKRVESYYNQAINYARSLNHILGTSLPESEASPIIKNIITVRTNLLK